MSLSTWLPLLQQGFSLAQSLDRVPGGENAALVLVTLITTITAIVAMRETRHSAIVGMVVAIFTIVLLISLGIGHMLTGLVLLMAALGTGLIAVRFGTS